MLNQRPIFIVGFQHGGTNLVLNLIRSHPEVGDANGELQELFIGKPEEAWRTRLPKLINYLPIMLNERQHVFHLSSWKKRKAFKHSSQKQIDKILYQQKLNAKDPSQNLYKDKNEFYTDEEIISLRPVTKLLNGLMYLTDSFAMMYPDATFIALIRNGLAVCEGAHRRGNDISQIASYYEQGCQKIIRDSQALPNYHVFRYEDLMTKPVETIDQIYKVADLDLAKLTGIRLEVKPTMNKRGEHFMPIGKNENDLIWYDLKNVTNHLIPDVNSHQIKRLNAEQKTIIMNKCRSSLEYFNYL